MCDLCTRFKKGHWQVVRGANDVVLDHVTARDARALVRELLQLGETTVSARSCPPNYFLSGAEALRALPCQMFVRCERHADGATAHPVLGVVPACRRCATTLEAPFIDVVLTAEVSAD